VVKREQDGGRCVQPQGRAPAAATVCRWASDRPLAVLVRRRCPSLLLLGSGVDAGWLPEDSVLELTALGQPAQEPKHHDRRLPCSVAEHLQFRVVALGSFHDLSPLVTGLRPRVSPGRVRKAAEALGLHVYEQLAASMGRSHRLRCHRN